MMENARQYLQEVQSENPLMEVLVMGTVEVAAQPIGGQSDGRGSPVLSARIMADVGQKRRVASRKRGGKMGTESVHSYDHLWLY